MRKLWIMTGFMLVFPFFFSSPASAEGLGDARLSVIQGDVVIQNMDIGPEWGAASVNVPLTPGTKVWVPENGRAEIQFLGGSNLRAAENTEVDISDLKISTEDHMLQVGVPQGRIYINYAASNARNSVFQVDSPIASVRAYGSSTLKVDVYEDGHTEVSVLKGTVYVEGPGGSVNVNSGSMLSMGPDQIAQLSPVRAADSWDRWNQSRDSVLARAGVSREYLPPTLNVYSSDFDNYGRWTSTADYGYVWTPRLTVANWSPYRIGRWCWIGADYVWVSYEPWGWVPYHYGRWTFIPEHGWCWVPPHRTAVYWSPGYVAWAHTPHYVAWVPLAPGEIYYGHGHYGPHSVNIKNVNVNKITITNVYVNAKVVNSVTVVNRETFLTGKSVRRLEAPKNPFTAGAKVSVGRPDIEPLKETSVPNPRKVISQRELPPRDVVTRAKKIGNRPIASDKDISVFKQGERAGSMRVDRSDRPKTLTEVQRPELRQPPLQKREMGKTPAREREIAPPPVQRGQPPGSSTEREFGIAPPHEEKSRGAPPARREEMNKTSEPGKVAPRTQPPQSLTPRREQTITPPPQRREVAPPSLQREQKSGPSPQREMGIAPPYRERSKEAPPMRREEMEKPSPPVHERGKRGGSDENPSRQREHSGKR